MGVRERVRGEGPNSHEHHHPVPVVPSWAPPAPRLPYVTPAPAFRSSSNAESQRPRATHSLRRCPIRPLSPSACGLPDDAMHPSLVVLAPPPSRTPEIQAGITSNAPTTKPLHQLFVLKATGQGHKQSNICTTYLYLGQPARKTPSH